MCTTGLPDRVEPRATFVAGFFMIGVMLVTLADARVVGNFLLEPARCPDSDELTGEAGLLGRTLVIVVGFLIGGLALLGLPFLTDLDEPGTAAILVGLTLWNVVAATVRECGLGFCSTDRALLLSDAKPKAPPWRLAWHRTATVHNFIVIVVCELYYVVCRSCFQNVMA